MLQWLKQVKKKVGFNVFLSCIIALYFQKVSFVLKNCNSLIRWSDVYTEKHRQLNRVDQSRTTGKTLLYQLHWENMALTLPGPGAPFPLGLPILRKYAITWWIKASSRWHILSHTLTNIKRIRRTTEENVT